jgi:hypothetical protein
VVTDQRLLELNQQIIGFIGKGEYEAQELDKLKNFYATHSDNRDIDVRSDVFEALEESDGHGNRDTQLLSLLSANDRDIGGENIEEDCKIGEQACKI